MINKKIIIVIFLISNFLLFLPKTTATESSDIVFTEIMYDLPGSDEDREWLEIFNQGTEPITIITGSGENSWRFNDGSNHLISLFQGSETMAGQSLAILAADGQTFLNEHPGFLGSIFDTTMNLNNTSDTIKLSADSGQTFFSEVTYDSNWGAAGNGLTLEKIDFFGSEARENWQESFVLGGTPGQNSSLEPPNQPPIAEAGDDQNVDLAQVVLFDGSLSVDPDNDLLSYFWDFGDNTNAVGVTTTHSYLATGTFVVILTVSDGELEDQDNLIINVSQPPNQPPIAEAGPDQTGQVNQTLTFNGANSSDPDGDELSFTWDFGNNQTVCGVNVTYTFTTIGNYLVTLYVNDGQATSSDTLIANIQVSQPPNLGGNTQDYSEILINEFLPNPQGSDENEWIELFNSGLSTINLNGLKIQDNSSTIYTINAEDFFTTQIYPNNYFIIERAVSGIALNNNGGDCVKLLSPANILIKQVCYNETAIDNKSYARKNDNSWGWTEILTKGSQNQFSTIFINQLPGNDNEATSTVAINSNEQPIITEALIISEFLPNPAGNDIGEFIEIYNQSTTTINLLNWQLDDSQGGSLPYKINEEKIILADQYLVFYKSETGISLNNTTDIVRLIDPNGTIIEIVDYSNPEEGLSYNYDLDGDDWYWAPPSPGETNNQLVESAPQNIISIANAQELQNGYLPLSISQVKELGKNQKVLISGIVTVLPGVLGKNIFYISEIDLTTKEIILESGIQIYCSKKDFPELKIGDIVEVNGETSESQGEKRIKIKTREDVTILENLILPEIPMLEISEIGDELLGGLVSVEGEIIDKQSNSLILADESGEIKIYLNKGLNFDSALLKESFQLAIIGIIRKDKAGLRLVPRTNADILAGTIISDNKPLKEELDFSAESIVMDQKKDNLKSYLLISLGVFIIVLAVIIIKAKMKNQLN